MRDEFVFVNAPRDLAELDFYLSKLLIEAHDRAQLARRNLVVTGSPAPHAPDGTAHIGLRLRVIDGSAQKPCQKHQGVFCGLVGQ